VGLLIFLVGEHGEGESLLAQNGYRLVLPWNGETVLAGIYPGLFLMGQT